MENQGEQDIGNIMNPESPNSETEFSYEDEQIQRILIKESEKHKIQMDQELREAQEREYQ